MPDKNIDGFNRLMDNIESQLKTLHNDVAAVNKDNTVQHTAITKQISDLDVKFTKEITRLDSIVRIRGTIAGAIPGIISLIISIIYVTIKLGGLE